MTDWSAVFLGVIALAVSVMAAIQVGIVVYGAKLARRVDALATQVVCDAVLASARGKAFVEVPASDIR